MCKWGWLSSVNLFSSCQDDASGNGLMKHLIVILTVLQIFLLTLPSRAAAYQVNKRSVILKEVKELKTPKGVLFAKEAIYVGGIGGNDFSPNPDCQEHGVTLRELRSPESTFTFSGGGVTIEATIIPMVAQKSQKCVWHPVPGKWDFKFDETNNYQSVIHVQMGGDLDIAYQSTGLKIGEREHVMHYGLSGNPHAIILSRKRLKNAFASPNSSSITPVLNYQPPNDIILVRIEVTPEGLLFEPIFDYQVAKE
jgi:hypothetical protein